jgi:hypothetical protein
VTNWVYLVVLMSARRGKDPRRVVYNELGSTYVLSNKTFVLVLIITYSLAYCRTHSKLAVVSLRLTATLNAGRGDISKIIGGSGSVLLGFRNSPHSAQ